MLNDMMPEERRLAQRRFASNPSKCFQRHLIEVWAELHPREQYPSVWECSVEEITKAECKAFIERYEYLGSLGRGQVFYGLRHQNGELLGANCFSHMGGKIADISGPAYKDKTILLARGACVMHAPPHAGSWFTSQAVKKAYTEYGWQIYFAYSDPEAGEMGTLYSSLNWHYIGEGVGTGNHYDYVSPDRKTTITSYDINHGGRSFMESLGWTDGPKRPWLRSQGWTQIVRGGKKKWIHFEGNRREVKAAKSACRYPLDLLYPKRSVEGNTEVINSGSLRGNTEPTLEESQVPVECTK
jgi:hypothetical protein